MRKNLRAMIVFLAVGSVACGNIQATDPDTNKKPVAEAFGEGDLEAMTGVSMSFDGSESEDVDGFLVAWEWDFGDGNTASGEKITYTYETPGNYSVSLTVRDDGQKTDSVSANITVESLEALGGTWELEADPATSICDNIHNSYAVAYPAPELTLSVSGTTVSGISSGTGTALSGEFGDAGALEMAGTSTQSDATCGTGTVQENLKIQFGSTQALTGEHVIQFTWSDVFCNCTKVFSVTGKRL